MSGHWPPEWDDPEEEFSAETDQADATVLASAGEARLSEVTAYLASIPVPVLPDAVEARITAALAAEAATRTDNAAPADAARKLVPNRTRARVRRQGGSGRPRLDSRSRPLLVVGSLVVCLLVGVGFALARGSTPTYSGLAGGPAAGANRAGTSSAAAGSADSGTVPAPSPAPVSSGPASSVSSAASSSASSASSSVSSAASSSSSSQYSAAGSGATVPFVVTTSGTNYQQATLAGQVRARLQGSVPKTPGSTIPAPSASSSSPAASASSTTSVSTALSPALRGCVLHLTDGVVPRLVDRATYQGEPAYIIATSSRVWVVGLGCTADTTELITSVPLAG